MAKKKGHKDDGEDEEFGPPPFDERQFYSSELELAKGTIVSALWGICIAFITTAIFTFSGEFYIGVAAGVAAALMLRPMLDRLKMIPKTMDIPKWLGLFFSYFMCWIAFWILLVNPPIMDLSPPHVKDRTPGLQELGGVLRLSVEVQENSGLSTITAEITLPNGTVDRLDDFEQPTLKLYQLNLGYNVTGTYSYHIRAEDNAGRAVTLEGFTQLVASQPPSIELIAPTDGTAITLDDSITLHVVDNALISGVHYTIGNDTEMIKLNYVKGGYQSYRSNGVNDNIYRIRPNASGHRWPVGTDMIEIFASDGAGNTANSTYTFILK